MFDANRAPILHQELHYLQTDRTELPLEPHHLGVPSSVSQTISMPMVCSVQTVQLSCTNTNAVFKWTKTRFHTTHVTYEFHRVCPKLFFEPMVRSVQTVHLCCVMSSTTFKRTEQSSTRPSSPRSTIGASKTINEPMVRLTQTEHLSCTDANTTLK
jgi:hypothetical protein